MDDFEVFDDYATEIQSDESQECAYWDDYEQPPEDFYEDDCPELMELRDYYFDHNPDAA